MKVLIIEDDPSIIDTVSLIFDLSWPEVKLISCNSGAKGIELVQKDPPDMIILDLGLPDMDGLEVLQRIRKFSNLPLIILSARTKQDSILKGLESGADDYITKPFDPMILVAHMKSVLRRNRMPDVIQGNGSVVCGDLTINLAKHEVALKEKQIRLTSTEWSLLNYLIQKEGMVVSHKELWEEIWGSEFIEDVSALRTCIWRLRAKLGEQDDCTNIIESYRSIGYRFVRPT